METLIKSTTNAMREMMSMIKNNYQAPNNQSNNQQAPNNQSNKKKREERRKKYNDSPICKYCGKKHPTKPEDECWELEKIRTPAHPTGSPQRVPEGVRGPYKK
jgi:hypothetical protein